MNGALFDKSVIANIIKDLKIRSSWMRVSPTSNDKCPEKRKGEGENAEEKVIGIWWQGLE